MIRIALLIAGFALMLVGPLLQGLSGSDNPNAYLFAPVLLAGSIPMLAGRNISPNPRIMAQGILLCGLIVLGMWYLGGLAAPMAIAPAAPVGCAIAGALIAAAANLLKFRDA
ncbi:hypothetical protein [Paracoccus aestuariivivens]|uniref:Uncharacterized protein n=1 Tax=Paracoccus aestuariivivens TaxID=1820333 RepID=A0A6L6JC52_9RHOB|nr:hypothetical protein [Paracoccus aestuariivivens]MTH78718.1 hypothetical protein [Paracoccus aestuariivivens]